MTANFAHVQNLFLRCLSPLKSSDEGSGGFVKVGASEVQASEQEYHHKFNAHIGYNSLPCIHSDDNVDEAPSSPWFVVMVDLEFTCFVQRPQRMAEFTLAHCVRTTVKGKLPIDKADMKCQPPSRRQIRNEGSHVVDDTRMQKTQN